MKKEVDNFDRCKHCKRLIKGSLHARGAQQGLINCDPKDTQSAYGYLAEPYGSVCGKNCIGHGD